MSRKLVFPATRFKRNVLALMGVFHGYFDNLTTDRVDMKYFNLAYAYVDNNDDEDQLTLDFITNTSSHWSQLAKRDDKYLLDNIMGFTSSQYQKKLKPYFEKVKSPGGGLRLGKDAIENAWEYVHNMVKCCIHFLHDHKTMKIITSSATLKALDPVKLAKSWGVDLEKECYESEESDEESS